MILRNFLRIVLWRLLGSKQPVPHSRKQAIIRNIQKKTKYKVFVETGTFQGDMVRAQKKYFRKIYSIELGIDLFEEAKKKFEGNPDIILINGDSGKVLSNITEQLNEPAIFWLDGHYSGGITARGDSECPILGELKAIIVKKQFAHVILIDDARLFVGANDYPTIKEIENYLTSNKVRYDLIVIDDIIKITVRQI